MAFELDTIVAVSTPPGRGGIGIVRLSGPQARVIAEGICGLKTPLAPRRTQLARVRDDTGRVLDEAVVTFFRAPHSYTAEDVVEVGLHGSPVVLHWVVRAALARGARLAEAGEFTERAFLAGRIDLTQAEAVHDLIAAQTLEQARVAAAQLGGSLARALGPAKTALIQLIAALEAGTDFAEDDLEVMPAEEIASRIEAVRAPLARLEASYAYGRMVHDGATLAIVGRPNAGKSSLFNRLLERERAIVTDQPGTTRDVLTEQFSLGGIPVRLADTAGLRDAVAGPAGEAERQGILRSHAMLAEADVVLHVIDATMPRHAEDDKIMAAAAGRPYLVALNKSDLVGERGAQDAGYAEPGVVRSSAVTNHGTMELKDALLGLLARAPAGADSAMLTNVRQHAALKGALEALGAAVEAVARGTPQEMMLMDLYGALRGVDLLTGATEVEDVLRVIFSTFCIGK